MKLMVALLAALVAGLNLVAAEALHTVKLQQCAEFEVVSPLGWISVFPVSEGMQRVVAGGSRKTILAADYSVGVIVKTENPSRALQAILRQIHEQTGRPLAKFINSSLGQMAPSAMLMAADADSVWSLVLTPKEGQPGNYVLSCGFVIDRKSEPVAAAAKSPSPAAK